MLARAEYKKVVQENNLLKRQLLGLKSTQAKQKKPPTKSRYVVVQSDNETDCAAETDTESEEEKKDKIEAVEKYPEVKIKKKKQRKK